ncbi:site-specific DNA-methyltransferase [Xanthomonas translucens pv. undulosa]|nr:site-specific DNA-methyltransferase [Xanthomonas translucens pv. undulosa]QSQ32121.1 site-specific DNA-methyltransferase [Xanthomonas translucens pv. translucens]
MPDTTPLSVDSANSSLSRTSLIKSRAVVTGGNLEPYTIWQGDAEAFLAALPECPTFDLVVSSPPYNIGKSYEKKGALQSYLEWQERILDLIIPRLKDTGSICWQVGNFVDNGEIQPLDIEMAYIFKKHGMKLRNRIIWHFGHGLHNKRRFSGRYEVVMWYSKTDEYFFNVDPVRIPSKYPGKRHFKGPKKGELSGNPLGKNPEDVWDIPNVKSNHVEKTDHPCQFPVGLIERLVLSMTRPGDLVFDPFSGVGSAGVAAAIHHRKFWGCELLADYSKQGKKRIDDALAGQAQYRPHDKAVYDHTQSNLSRVVERNISKERK